MQTDTRAKQVLVIASLYLVLILAGYIFLFFHIQNKSTEANTIQEEIALIREQNAQFRNLSGVVKNIDTNREKLNNFFVDDEKIVGFLETLESLSDSSGAEVKVKTINEIEKEKNKPAQLSLNVTAEGSWGEVYHFLSLLENIPLKLTLDQTQMRIVNSFDEEAVEEKWLGVFNFRVLKLDS